MSTKGINRTFVSFDWAIKRLLRDKADFGILEGFLSVLLNQDIVIEEILESETNREQQDDKQIVVDILCKTRKQELVLIEIQFRNQLDFFHRMLYGTSRIMTERLKIGEAYGRVVKVYSINLVYFDLGHGDDYVYHGKTAFRGIHKGDLLQTSAAQQKAFQKTDPGELFPEYYILKINQFDNVAKTPLDEWLYYLKNSELPKKYKAKGLSLVAEKLKVQQMDVTELSAYKKYKAKIAIDKSAMETAYIEGTLKGEREGLLKGKQEGRQEGLLEGLRKGTLKGKQEGRQENQIDAVVSGYRKGYSIQIIADIMSLHEAEVIQILRSQGLE
jgi:predicted transposase/invertase (TIGR01784 family)